MASDEGTTIGIWVGERERDLVESFDDAFGCGPDHVGSRSEEVKEAMRLAIAVRETADELPYEIEGAPLRHLVQQALVEQDRREATRDG